MKISYSQNIFLNGLDTRFRAFVGGYGSGKTFVGCLDLGIAALRSPKIVQGYFGTTYPSIKDIFYPTVEEALHPMGIDCLVKLADKEVTLMRGNRYIGTVICRSMDNPNSIVGFKIARALVDEIDTLNKIKAKQAWNRIIARLRLQVDGVTNSIGVTTTPEGFNFVYDRFHKNATESYSMVRASTYENKEHLPDGYIESLIDSYPEQLISAYIKGEFVNLTSGTVYNNFDRVANNTNVTWDGKEPVYIGMDFNVGKMAAVTHVKRGGNPYAVDEIIDAYDTPAIIRIIQDRYRDCTVRIYPDASGGSRKSVNASHTDLSMLQSAGFRVITNKKNPFVKDRVNAMNNMFKSSTGEIKYRVNVEKCPTYADCLEQQIWKNGEPDKSSDNDHPNDAGGYFIAMDYPIIKPVAKYSVSFAK